MSLREVLSEEMENSFAVTERLIRMVHSDQLAWKPATGSNWMTVGQLLWHCSSACGVAMRAFVTGEWGLPEGVEFKDLTPEDILPPAEKLPAVESIEQALQLLGEDRQVGASVLREVPEADLLGRRFSPPWGGAECTLFQHLLHMIEHLGQHKGQLFYYLKLLGHDVKTEDLWGDL
ncbi:MAG: DinB family protein [Acidobacteriota bacterium]